MSFSCKSDHRQMCGAGNKGLAALLVQQQSGPLPATAPVEDKKLQHDYSLFSILFIQSGLPSHPPLPFKALRVSSLYQYFSVWTETINSHYVLSLRLSALVQRLKSSRKIVLKYSSSSQHHKSTENI